MNSRVANLPILLLLMLGLQLPVHAQPAPPPVDLREEPAPLAPQAAGPVSPETPMAGPVNSNAVVSEGAIYQDDGYYGGPASRRYLNFGGGGLASHFPGMWGNFDGLVWWNKGRHLPPLVTTSPNGTVMADAGVIGTPGTTALFGNQQVGNQAQGGGRADFGIWLDPNSNLGIGARITSVAGDDVNYSNQTDGSLILGRPFYNVGNNARDALLIGYPGEFSGTVNASSASSFFMTDIYARCRLSDNAVNRIDFLAGYQYARIDDNFTIGSVTTNIDPLSGSNGFVYNYFDSFRATTNKYDGATLGLSGDWVHGRAKISWLGKVGYGNMHEVLTINGNSSVMAGGTTVPLTGGLLAQTSNIGTYVYNRHVFVPEVNMNFHVQVTQRLDVSVGYSFIYFTNILLAGDQIDRRVNLSQQTGPLVGQAFPLPQSNNTDFWLQGLNFGLNGTF